MRGGVDAACKAGGDGETGFAQIRRKTSREFTSQRGRVACTDDAPHLARQQRDMAENGNDRRWWIECREAGRKFRFGGGDKAATDLVKLLDFFLRVGIGWRTKRLPT